MHTWSRIVSDRAYVLIYVEPRHTARVVCALQAIAEIQSIDPCWGKPDIITLVEVSDQDALTKLVLTQIHAIPEVIRTETHMVYRLLAKKP